MKNGPGSINRVYRLVWNDRNGTFVAVAESARGRGKRSSGVVGAVGAVVAASLLASGGALAADPPAANALPSGGAVAAGQASLNQAGNRLDITQGSGRATINWQSFDIGSQAQVRISQPDARAVLLNRVLGADPSAIYGKLSSNGQVLLVNPNGIVFGKGSQVDVGGIVASTLAIADADFDAGRMKFTRNGASGSVLNQGSLKAAAGGYVALLAPEVVNEGVVSAQLGTVALAAGNTVTLDLNGSQLLGVKVDPASIATLVDNRQLIQAEGGRVILSAGAAQRLREQAVAGATGATDLVEQGGTMRLVSVSGSIQAGGGQVAIAGSTVDLSGQVSVAGRQAGQIDVQADHVSQGGTLDASATAGAGGRITLGSGALVQTASARLKADGSSAGGSVRIDGGNTVYSSASISAQGGGGTGGDIALSADSVQLRAATLDASGSTGGGRIRVGGGFHGQDGDIGNARQLGVNGSTVLRADATVAGDGGQVVLWSDDSTVYGGQLSARGGAQGGNGGRAEVSGKGDLSFAGGADLAAPKGQAGQLLLDPRNIIIDSAGNSIASLNLADPTPSSTDGFGTLTQVLTNGNVIITAPNAATGGSAATGAVYLFDSSTGALLSNLRGSHVGDHAGSAGVQLLSNGNYLVLSPAYGTVGSVNTFSLATTDPSTVPGASAYAILQGSSASAGAITWQSATGSNASLIGSGNSLVGSTANSDSVTRYSYAGNAINNNGSITVTANDQLGNVTTYDAYGSVVTAGTTRIMQLFDGNVAIATPNWFNGRGAVTWMNGSNGALANAAAGGALSASTSIVGSTGIRSQAVVSTDSSSNKVWVIGVDSALPYTYTQGSTNRRTAPPGGAGDSVGQALTALPDGGYVIASPLWSNGGTAYAGAVTHGAAGGSTGTVASSNSLVGSHAYDFVGSGGVSPVGSSGGNYVVASPYWSDSVNAATGRYLENNPNGAVTWVDGSSGNVFGTGSPGAVVSNVNSLAAIAGSQVGARDSSTYTPYTAYDYNLSNQLNTTSSTRKQASGSDGVTLLTNGNYLVVTNAWNGGKGAVTFGNGSSGVGGVISASKSLVGATAGDSSGNSVVELSGSNYVVVAPYSDAGAVDGGAVSWGSGTSGVTGTVGTGNSLYGSQVGARVGSGGVLPVGSIGGDGLRANFIVLSPQWGNRSASTSTVAYGAVTWVDGSNGYAWGQGSGGGAISSANSLVGSSAGDYVGSIHTADTRAANYSGDGSSLYQVTGAWDAQLSASVNVLANGDYIVRSPNWAGGKGAISWGAGGSGTGGAVSSGNSLVGSTADVLVTSSASQTRAGFAFTDTTYKLTTTGDHVGLLGQGLSNSNYVAISPYWSTGRGAVSWVGSGNRTGTVSSANSLVGSTPDVYSDANQSALTATGDRLGTLPNGSWVVPVVSDATVSGQTYTTATLRPTGPYAFDTSNTVTTLSWYGGGGNVNVGKSYGVTSPQNASLVSEWGYLTTSFQYNGYPIVKELANGNVLVASPGWNNGSATRAGAISWINGATGALAGGGNGGAVSTSNSLVGSHSDDVLGFRLPVDGIAELGSGNFLLVNPQWYAERGAVTWGSGTAGVTGTVSASNSLVGGTGSAGLGFTAPGGYVYRIVGGAVLNSDWVDRSSDLTGDRVGIAGVTALADGNAVIGSPLWSQSSAWSQVAAPSSLGAATWIDGSNGQLRTGAAGGAISSSNSLVGSQHGDAVGYSAWVDPNSGQHYVASGITALAGGRYAVASPWWSNGSVAQVGAVTFSAAGGMAGAVSTGNSLVGASAGDHVGRSLSSVDSYSYGALIDPGVQVLDTGSAVNYMVRSVDWTNPYDTTSGGAGAGAVTWVSGSNGRAWGESGVGAVVSAANSLVGNVAGDGVGAQAISLTRQVSGHAVASGDLLLLSNLEYCGTPGAGAITLLSGSNGAAGPISWRNSVIGLAPASGGLATTGFDGYSYTTDIRATLLPTAVTAAEQVAWRPLVWVAPDAVSGKNASQALALTVVADNNAVASSADQVNSSGPNANWAGSLYAGNGSGYTGVGGNSATGLLAFSANAGIDVVITPSTLTGLLNAGTAVTLQASNDITVLRDITAAAGGSGGNLTLEAGRSVHLRANIGTDNGDFTAIANQGVAAGVIDNDCSVCTAVISQAAGKSISTGTGHLTLSLLNSADKTSNDAGTIRLSMLDGANIQVSNAGLSSGGQGRGIRFNSGAVLGSGVTERLELYVGGNSAAGGALVLASDTQLVASDTLMVAPADLGTMRLGAASGSGLAMTAAEMGAFIQRSSGWATLQFGSANQTGATIVSALDFTQAQMLRGSSTLSADVRLAGGSGGINVNGLLKSAAADGGNELEINDTGGAITLGASSALTASTGNLRFTSFGGSVAQLAGSTINAAHLYFGGDGSGTLTAGTNTIGSVAGGFASLNLKTSGSTTVGSDGLALDTGLVLQASGASADITLGGVVSTSSGSLVLAAGRNFVNNNASNTGLDAGSGRYLVYSTNPAASTEGMTGYGKHYAQSYNAGSTPGYAGSGNWFLYSVAPTLAVSAGSGSTVTYGSNASAPSVGISGYIDGDTQASATSGTLATSLSGYTPSSAGYIPAGSYTLNLSGQGTFASSLGYAINVTPGSSTLTVQPKAIAVAGLTANGKVYDGTTSTTVSGTASLTGGGASSGDGKFMAADAVSVSGTASGSFADRHAGVGKSVTLGGLSLSGADSTNYTISAGSVTATITPKALTANGLSVAASKVYDSGTGATVSGTAALLTAEAAGSGNTGDGKPYSGDVLTLGGTASGSYNAATVAGASTVSFGGISLGGAQAGDYTLNLGSQAATITPKALSVSGLTAQNKVYDASTAVTFSGTAGLSGIVGGDAVGLGGTFVAAFADANAGNNKSITTSGLGLTGGAAGNYSLAAYSPQANISKRTVNVTAADAAKTWGDADPALTFGVGGLGLAGSDTAASVFSGAIATTTGASATAGTHAITQGTLAVGNGNYQLGSYTAGTLTVAKAALAVSADAQGKTYGGADPTLSYSVNPGQLKYSDTAAVVSGVSLATATGAAATAGTHAITASGGSAANYNVVLSDGTLTVAKAALGVSADAQGKTYGGIDPTLSYTVNASQLKYSDTADVVSGVNLATATGAAATAGTHAIGASGGTAANYDLVLTDGTLTVAKASLAVHADAKAKTYGDADPTLSYSVDSGQLKYGDAAAVVSGVGLGTATGAAATAGTHAITATGGTAANYNLVLSGATLTVAKATLPVSADAKGKTYGDADPVLTYSVDASRLKYSDTAAVVSGVNLGTVTGAAATAGLHAITASGGTAANYTVVASDGTLTVAKAALGVSADGKSKTYGGADPTLTYSVNGSQLKYGDSAGVVSGVSLSTATGAAATAGTHAIAATGGTAANYTLVLGDGTLAVAKAPLAVSADARSKVYGDADPVLSFSVNPAQLQYADTAAVVGGVGLSTVTGAAATAGTHAITASGGSAANYTLVLGDGTLTVARASLAVSADARSKVYGDADPALSYSVNASQLKYGDSAGVVSGVNLSTVTGAAATAGTHAITTSGGTAANYAVVTSDGTLTVAKAALGVSADARSKVYGDADPTLGYSVDASQLKYGDSAGVVSGVALSTATGAAATAGSHAIAVMGGAADNYRLVPTNGALTVAKAALAVSADARSKVYGDADPTLGYSVDASQLKYGDTAGVVGGIVLSAPTGAAATAGSHVIAASGGVADNYAVTTTNGTLTVGRAALTVAADAKRKVYGDADPALSYTVDASQLKYGDGAGVVGGVGLSAPTGAAATAGTHVIVASGGSAANYVLTLVDGTLTVARAALTVTADDQAKTSGERDPALGYTVNSAQLKYGDTAGVVGGVKVSAPGGAGLPPGSYAIVAADGTAANYALQYVDGLLTVKPSPSVKAENLSSQLSPAANAAAPVVVAAVTGNAPAAAAGQPGSLVVRDGGVSGTGAGSAGGVAGGIAGGTVTGTAPGAATGATTGATTGAATGAATGTAIGTATGTPTGAATGAAAGSAENSAPGNAVSGAAGTASPSGSASTGGNATATPTVPSTVGTSPAAGSDTGASTARLVAIQPQSRVTAEPGSALRFDASANFERPPQTNVGYSARQADGKPLPSWLTLDSATGVLSGAPPAGAPSTVEVVVTAQIEGGSAATTRLSLRVGKAR